MTFTKITSKQYDKLTAGCTVEFTTWNTKRDGSMDRVYKINSVTPAGVYIGDWFIDRRRILAYIPAGYSLYNVGYAKGLRGAKLLATKQGLTEVRQGGTVLAVKVDGKWTTPAVEEVDLDDLDFASLR